MTEIAQTLPQPNSRIRFLAFRFYEGCPVGCDHCAISAPKSNPTRGKVTSDDVLKLTDLGQRLNAKRVIFMTGSELLVGDSEFRELAAELVLGRSFTLGVLTSAYWAKTDRGLKEGIHYLRLCGVSHIQLSSDHFHSRAIDSRRAIEISARLQDEGFSLLINKTVPEESQLINSEKSIETAPQLIFSSSAVGRGRTQKGSSTRAPCTPFHNCDFSHALYLQGDRNIYFCSGPGGMAKGRAVGYAHEDIGLKFYPPAVPKLKNEIDSVISNSFNGESDACSVCASHFLALDVPWKRGLS